MLNILIKATIIKSLKKRAKLTIIFLKNVINMCGKQAAQNIKQQNTLDIV